MTEWVFGERFTETAHPYISRGGCTSLKKMIHIQWETTASPNVGICDTTLFFSRVLHYISGFLCISSSHPISRCWTLRNQFRQRNQFRPIPGIPYRNRLHILGTNLGTYHNACGDRFRESSNSGIGRNSGIESMRSQTEPELIPSAESVTKRSTSLNRIYSLYF